MEPPDTPVPNSNPPVELQLECPESMEREPVGPPAEETPEPRNKLPLGPPPELAPEDIEREPLGPDTVGPVERTAEPLSA